jgi:uridine kinase
MPDIKTVVNQILNARSEIPVRQSVLVAITGIDGCGKGYVTAQVVDALRSEGGRVASINVEGWLNLPDKRFDTSNLAEHFYLNAIRFEEMFDHLVLPLRDRRSLRIEANYTEKTAMDYRRYVYEFEDIDVIVLEGIYLLKRDFRHHYDLSCWIDCSFKTALQLIVSRGQEGLSPEETTQACRKIYFPAQEIHFKNDKPRAAATLIVNNDAQLKPGERTK